jgi:hypothetical protein
MNEGAILLRDRRELSRTTRYTIDMKAWSAWIKGHRVTLGGGIA